MNLFLLRAAGVVFGFFIPVLLTLAFSLLVGKAAPRLASREGRLRPLFILLYVVVWMIGTTLSGFLISVLAPPLAFVTSIVLAGLLCTLLWSNVGEMKKRQSALQIVGMTIATVGGVILGCFLYLAIQAPVN
jgi:predicted branched-subunit amino acid permease